MLETDTQAFATDAGVKPSDTVVLVCFDRTCMRVAPGGHHDEQVRPDPCRLPAAGCWLVAPGSLDDRRGVVHE